jgi:hypothetical protein
MRTSAALSTDEGTNVLAGGGFDLSPVQRALADDEDLVARSPGEHAEVTAVKGALQEGLTRNDLGLSRPICAACQDYLEQSGATITGPTTASWWDQ